MGNCCEPPHKIDHFIYVKTGDRKGVASDVTLKILLQDAKGKQSNEMKLELRLKNNFEPGKTEVFDAPTLNEFADIYRVEFWKEAPGMEGPATADWFLETIVVNNRHTERNFYFPFGRWVLPNQHYKVELFDTMLPQLDPNKEQRQKEMELNQELYQYGQSAPDLPVQVSTLPPYEQFSDEYKCDIINSQFQLINKSNISRLPNQPWESLEELTNIYVPNLPAPVGMDRWSNDLCFGAQRLIGCNPTMVKLCTDLPESMGVTAEMLRPFLEGWTMKQIIEAKRLFVVDLKVLKNLPTATLR